MSIPGNRDASAFIQRKVAAIVADMPGVFTWKQRCIHLHLEISPQRRRSSVGMTGNKWWVNYGCRSLRKDLLLAHEKSGQHRDAVKAALSKTGRIDVTLQAVDHRLALACKNSFSKTPLLTKVDNTLDALNKYYKYSAVHHAGLQKVQAAFGEPQLNMEEATHH